VGSLKPGAQYIYERADGITYAREVGAPLVTRFEIGRDYNRKFQDEQLLWKEIVLEAEKNNTLKEALEKVKVLYYLSKESEQK
jgi:hypothetical protein